MIINAIRLTWLVGNLLERLKCALTVRERGVKKILIIIMMNFVYITECC